MDDKRCRMCERLYELGRNGVCRACQRAISSPAGRNRHTRYKKHKRLRCDCGKQAVTVKKVRVGAGGVYQVRLPLCANCLKVEESYGLDGSATNPDPSTSA